MVVLGHPHQILVAPKEALPGEAMSILSFLKRCAKSPYADDRAVDDFTHVLDQTKPSAFDVAMEETRQADAALWAKLERDLKP